MYITVSQPKTCHIVQHNVCLYVSFHERRQNTTYAHSKAHDQYMLEILIRIVVAIAMLTTQLCTLQDITVSGNATIVRWLYAKMSVKTASTCTNTILLRQHTQNFDYKRHTYLLNKCYTGETEYMHANSTLIKCYA